MLKRLKIENLLLIPSAEIQFLPGLNILSGESGAGKSALLHALSLLSGCKAEAKWVRPNTTTCKVEAEFDLLANTPIEILLKEAGIEWEPNEPLVLRREIDINGRSRAFVFAVQVNASFLAKIAEHLIDRVGQHASQTLLTSSNHRFVLDQYAGINQTVHSFQALFFETQALSKKLDELKSLNASKIREEDRLKMELEELSSLVLDEEEEKKTFEEYERLSSSEELQSGLLECEKYTSASKEMLVKAKTQTQKLAKVANDIAPELERLESLLLELEDVRQTFEEKASQEAPNPALQDKLEKKLKLYEKIKRKYGPTLADVKQYEEEIQAKLKTLSLVEDQIEETEKAKLALSKELEKTASIISSKRKEAAETFSQEVLIHLRELHLPKTSFVVSLSPENRTSYGDEHVEFLFASNSSNAPQPLKTCSSGGELARVLLSIKALEGEKHSPTLLLDEIDSGIGGETAHAVGSKIKELSHKRQILCITHLAQVAKDADHHLFIEKIEEDGSSFSRITALNKTMRTKEIARMLGAKSLGKRAEALAKDLMQKL